MAHVFRAMTGLYLALGLFWLFAAFNDQYRNAAVLTCPHARLNLSSVVPNATK